MSNDNKPRVTEIRPGISQGQPLHDLSSAEFATVGDKPDISTLEVVGQTLTGNRGEKHQYHNRRVGLATIASALALVGSGLAIKLTSDSRDSQPKPRPAPITRTVSPSGNRVQQRVQELNEIMTENPNDAVSVEVNPGDGPDQLGERVDPADYIRTDGVQGYPADSKSVLERAAVRQLVKEETAATGGQPQPGEHLEMPKIPGEQASQSNQPPKY